MRLLLDTHIVLAIVNESVDQLPLSHRHLVDDASQEFACSVASLWEIAIKYRLGKLPLKVSLDKIGATCRSYNLEVLPIDAQHVLADLAPEPPTRDQFDRLLLAQASVEGMRLVTIDRALANHPLAWTPAPPPPQPP